MHTVCCTSSELPPTFTVAPCNKNENPFIKPLLQKLKKLDVNFNTVLADAQYDSAKVRDTMKEYDAEPVTPYRRRSKISKALRVGRDFTVQGVKRLVNIQETRKHRKEIWQSQRVASTGPLKSQRTRTSLHTRILKLHGHAHNSPDSDQTG